jgi:pyruvate dehydrogenase E2 component (dihydrolipoamide acetyltransferase)
LSKVVEEEVVVGKTSLSYRRTSGRGHPVVMFHGFMDSAESWDPFARSLSRPSLAFDLPGFGHSSLAGDDIWKWQGLFDRALKKLEVESFFLLGHSLGGALASAVAARQPERVRALLVIASAGYSRIPLAQFLARPEIEFLLGRTAPRAMRFRPLVNLTYRNLFSHHHHPSDDLMGRLTASRNEMVPAIKNGMHVLRELSLNGFKESPYEGPVAGLWGEHDRLVPPKHSIKGLLDVFPEAQTELLEGVGHHPQEEEPGETLDWIAKQTDSGIRELMLLSADLPFD